MRRTKCKTPIPALVEFLLLTLVFILLDESCLRGADPLLPTTHPDSRENHPSLFKRGAGGEFWTGCKYVLFHNPISQIRDTINGIFFLLLPGYIFHHDFRGLMIGIGFQAFPETLNSLIGSIESVICKSLDVCALLSSSPSSLPLFRLG